MALFNSIVIGKASGKIGNVVLCSLKGQNVAKSRNYSPTNPRTVLQTNSRAKMSNAVMAWQFLSIFLVHINALRKSTESNYNAFIRLSKNFFDTTVATAYVDAVKQLHSLNLGSSNFTNVLSYNVQDTDIGVAFSTGGAPYVADTLIRCINYDITTGANKIIVQQVSEQEWTEGNVIILDANLNNKYFSVYMYSLSENKCSNILF